MIELPERFDSIFRYLEVVSQRAEQIIRGARPRTDVRAAKPTLQARDDVDAGQVGWRILTQEELDAQRQAMVEQFRAEMESSEESMESAEVTDVLPTGAGGGEAEVEAADDDSDDELKRLQQLLGLAGASVGAGADDGEAEGPDPLDDAVELEAENGDGEVDEED